MGGNYKLLDSEFLYVSSSGEEPWVTASGESFITMSSLHAGAIAQGEKSETLWESNERFVISPQKKNALRNITLRSKYTSKSFTDFPPLPKSFLGYQMKNNDSSPG